MSTFTQLTETRQLSHGKDQVRPSDAMRRLDLIAAGRVLLAVIAGCLAASASASPTGIGWWDDVLAATVAVIFVVAASMAPRFFVIVGASLATGFADGQPWGYLALFGLLLAAATLAADDEHRLLRTASAACTAQGLLRLTPFGSFGMPSIVVGILVSLAAILAIRSLGRSRRKMVLRVVAALVIFGGLAVALGLATLLSARSDVNRAAAASRSGLAAARAGDSERVERELAVANDAFARARDQIGSPLVAPLRWAPISAQNIRAVDGALTSAASVVDVAVDVGDSDGFAALNMQGGGVDLVAIAELQGELTRAAETLRQVSASLQATDRDWIVSQVGTQLNAMQVEVDEALIEVQAGADAAEMLPPLLGGQGSRRYFVALGTPAQSRELGGMLGSYVLINVDEGDVSIVEAGRIRELYTVARASEYDEADFPRWYLQNGQPWQWPQNLTGSPDVAVVAEGIRQILDGVGDGRIDGVIYLDTWALVDLLKIVGPVDVSWRDEPLSATTAPDFLFADQYRFDSVGFDEFEEFDEQRTDAFDEFEELLDVVMTQMFETGLPGPDQLQATLGPAARSGRLQVVTFDETENDYLRSIGVQREFGWSSAESDDAFAVIQTNGAANKMDLYLHRDVRYDVSVDGQGRVEASLAVEITSDLPADPPQYAIGRVAPGESYVLLSVYSPHQLESLFVDGEEVPAAVAVENGYRRYLVPVTVAADSSVVVTFNLAGQILPGKDTYELDIWHQPLVTADTVEVVFHGPNGGVVKDSFALTEDVTATFDATN